MKNLLTTVNDLYGLDINSSKKVTKGFLSENYILTGRGQRYFLKKYRFDKQERIEEVHAAKKYFADGGIPVVLPIVNKDNKSFFHFENGYFALFPFISDRQIERGSLNAVTIESLGEMLGRIHLLGKTANLPIKERFKAWNKESFLEKIDAIYNEIDKKSELNDFDRLALESIETKKKLILDNTFIYEDLQLTSDHLIHGDYLDHNVFVGPDNKVSYVFDFEKTDYSPRMYELYRSLMYCFLSGEVTDSDIAHAKRYLNAYLAVYPTSRDELSRGLKLFYLKSIHGVWVESEHFLKGSDRVDEFLLNDFRRIKYFSVNFKDFENKLLSH